MSPTPPPCAWEASSHTQQSFRYGRPERWHFLCFVEATAYSCLESPMTVQVPYPPSARPRSVYPWPLVSKCGPLAH